MKTYNPISMHIKASCLAALLFSQAGFACDDVIFNNGFETAYEVSINVADLGNNSAGRTLVVQLNGGESLTLTTDGLSSFCTTLPVNSNYQVTITSQPQTGIACVLNNDSGIVTADTTVTATCGQSRWDEMNWDENNWN